MPRLPGSMLVIARPAWSLIRVMWYSNGPGEASNFQSKSEPQNSRPLAVSRDRMPNSLLDRRHHNLISCLAVCELLELDAPRPAGSIVTGCRGSSAAHPSRLVVLPG